MKKFLAVFDGYKPSASTLAYAISLSKSAGAHLNGLFLDEFVYRTYSVTSVIKKYENADEVIERLDEKDRKKRDAAVQYFEKACSDAGLNWSVTRDTDIALQELKHESIYADLLIIDKNENFSRIKEDPPTHFVRELLRDIQCPAIIVPENFRDTEAVVFLYDGSPSAVYAIKMYGYLFSGMESVPAEVFCVKESGGREFIPDEKFMKEFVHRYLPDASFKAEAGNADEKIVQHLKPGTNAVMAVLGAYRRTDLSRWFKSSMADLLMKECAAPLFIAHYK
ncbi:MAG: universal stress protein [Ferruginibacter sp.]